MAFAGGPETMKITSVVHHPRRPKATWVVLLASIALVFTTLSFNAAASPVQSKAATKLTTPKLVVMSGTKQFIASWNKVPGAKKYALQYARNSKFKKAKTIKTAITYKKAKRLTNYRDYWVRVIAYSSTGAKRTSRTVKIRPSLSPPGRPAIKIVPAGGNKFKVGWSAPRQATALRIVGSYDNLAMKSKSTRFSFGVKPTARSATITIPKSFQRWVGQGTGNPLYLQMWAYNKKRISTSLLAFKAATPPASYTGSADHVTFSSYNVTSVAASASHKGRTWENRRGAVRNAVRKAGASVFAAQELTTARGKSGVPQYQDLDALLPEYKLAYSYEDVGSAAGNLTKGDHIFYKPSDVDVLDSGVQSPKRITPSSVKWLKADGKSKEKDRPFGWARMRLKSSGTEFYVVSIHLQNGTSVHTQRLRVGVIKAINAFIKKKAGNQVVPIIMAGDFNSDVTRYRNGAPAQLIADGYKDSRATARTFGSKYATTNSQPASAAGFPSRPFHYKYAPTKIDFILAKNAGGSVEHHNQVILKNGKFDESYRGSDHNLQWTKLVLPRRLY